MFKLSKQTDYGLILLTALANLPPNEYLGLKTISKDHNLPYKFIGQIATKLKKANIIRSKEGTGGGYQLAHKPHDITLNNIVSSLEGPVQPTACLRGEQCRCQSSCQHRSVVSDLSHTVEKVMSNYSLEDIVNNNS